MVTRKSRPQLTRSSGRGICGNYQNLNNQNVHLPQKRLGQIGRSCRPISQNNGQFDFTKRTKLVKLHRSMNMLWYPTKVAMGITWSDIKGPYQYEWPVCDTRCSSIPRFYPELCPLWFTSLGFLILFWQKGNQNKGKHSHHLCDWGSPLGQVTSSLNAIWWEDITDNV